MSRVLVRCLLAACLTWASAGLGYADDTDPTDPKYTLMDPDGNDLDFDIQGEFKGHAQLSPFSSLEFGLQVVAQGSGRFQGQLLIGGLPGDGWTGMAKIRLIGEREGRILTLVGGPYSVTIRGTETNAYVRFQNSDLVLGGLARVRRMSPTLGAPVPAGGTLLFSGIQGPPPTPIVICNPCCPCCPCVICPPPPEVGTSLWDNANLTEEGLLLGGAKTKALYDNFKLHVEFRVPFMPNARGQSRGNSGVYLNGRQEIQILDSFGLAGVENEAGAIYKYKAPDINMALPPLVWQTYDITYQAPVFNAKGKKTQNVRISVEHNGVLVQNNVEVESPTGAGPAESPVLLPLTLQNHGNPVVFRNIWIVPQGAVAN